MFGHSHLVNTVTIWFTIKIFFYREISRNKFLNSFLQTCHIADIGVKRQSFENSTKVSD